MKSNGIDQKTSYVFHETFQNQVVQDDEPEKDKSRVSSFLLLFRQS